MSIETVDNAFLERRKDHNRRRETSKRIRDARHKLANASGTRPEFHYDLLYIFARNELSAALAAPLLACAVAAASSYWVVSTSIIVWLAAIFASEAILLILCRQFLNESRNDVDLPTWRHKLTAAALCSGASWAAIALFLTADGRSTADIVIFSALIVVLCIRTMFASTVLAVIYASTIPMTAALVIRFALSDSELNWIMAAMAVGVQAYFIFLTRSLNGTVLSMLELRAEKDALIAEIEESKSISDEARLRAESANLAKSRFLATMSHELRTPLNAILGFSEILKSELFGPHSNPTYKDYAKDIHESGEHLLKVINDILDLSRIEADRYDLKEEAMSLAGCADDCIRLLRLRAESKGLTIKETIAYDLPKLWAEQKAVRQVILNLLSNAIKFTPKGGTVTVEIDETEDGGQYVAVHDTGPGIPEDELGKVMSPFGQGSLAHETAEGGTGLGLPIVKRLMDVHGGIFKMQSTLRKGTSVTATFPAKRSMKALPPMPTKGESPASQYRQPPNERAAARPAGSKRLPKTTRAADAKDRQRAKKAESDRLEQLAYGKKSPRTAKLVENAPAEPQPQNEEDPAGHELRELAKSMRKKEQHAEQQQSDEKTPAEDISSLAVRQNKV